MTCSFGLPQQNWPTLVSQWQNQTSFFRSTHHLPNLRESCVLVSDLYFQIWHQDVTVHQFVEPSKQELLAWQGHGATAGLSQPKRPANVPIFIRHFKERRESVIQVFHGHHLILRHIWNLNLSTIPRHKLCTTRGLVATSPNSPSSTVFILAAAPL